METHNFLTQYFPINIW